jgi:hypothetical protein
MRSCFALFKNQMHPSDAPGLFVEVVGVCRHEKFLTTYQQSHSDGVHLAQGKYVCRGDRMTSVNMGL